ncbi:MAG: penicillin-binding protein 2 [Phycisphaerae bacterium]|jgi:cell division protein FtsI (penicillin-binding protein 3)|nr:penicillin-binding protein 2 [Phycisphaerae bacterium]
MEGQVGPKWRHNVVFGGMILILLALGGRLWHMRAMYSDKAKQMAQRQQSYVIRIPARIGNIYAVAHNRPVLLATSRQAPTCFVDPSLLDDYEIAEVADSVEQTLSLEPMAVQDLLMARRDKKYAPVKENPNREITPGQMIALRALKNRAIGVEHQWVRGYPCGTLAGSVVGFRMRDGKPGGGLELSLNKHLTAFDGKREILVDAARRAVRLKPGKSVPPRDGNHIFLCLDAVIQNHLQEALNASVAKYGGFKTWAVGVVVEPTTGRVLAMCSVPNFDPNASNRPGAIATNRAVLMPFEPGSVVKPLFAAAAVSEGLVTWDTKIFCENGCYRPPRGGRITDHGKSYGMKSVTDGVVLSINTLMAKLGGMMGNKTLHKWVMKFGFGRRTDIPLPGEEPGLIRKLKDWDTYSTPRVPFGQEMAVTSLQLAMAFSAVANDGLLLKPRLVDRIVDPQGKVLHVESRKVVRPVFTPAVARQCRLVMQQVVERGTGKRCKMEHWTSFGKTGTAQIAGPGGMGYADGAYTASFVGGAPVKKPRLLCVISVYWPDRSKAYYGGTVAAPYVKQVLEKSLTYLKVPPDKGIGIASSAAGR